MSPPSPGGTGAPERGVGSRPAPPPQLPAPTGTTGNKPARANASRRHTDRARRRQASTNRSGMGATPSMTRTTPVTPPLLPAQGRQRDGTRQSHPPPHWPPRPHKRGARHTGRAQLPPTHPLARTPRTRRPTPRGAPNPKPGRGETGPGRPPPSTPNRARDRGRTRGGARTAWNGPTSAQGGTAQGARATPTGKGGAGTHTKGTRGIPEGQPDRARGTHRPRGMAYQRARYGTPGRDGPPHTARDTRGRKGETGETRRQVPAGAPRTGRERRAHTARALHPPRQ